MKSEGEADDRVPANLIGRIHPAYSSKISTRKDVPDLLHPAYIACDPSAQQRQTMLCIRCLRATAVRRQLPLARQFSISRPIRSAEPQLSTPVTEPGEEATPASAARSICKEGTVLNGLNYLNGKQDPVALKDDEYPEWLWSCLDVMKKATEEGGENMGDEFGTQPLHLQFTSLQPCPVPK